MKYVLDSCVALTYVTLAERELCKHLTADDRLIRALQPTFPFITSLASLP
jgi:predicted nucleic acid-binding protein